MARSFNGSTDHITSTRVTAATTNVTLSAWAYPTAATGHNFIFGNSAGGTDGYSMEIVTGSTIGIFLGGVVEQNSGVSIALNAWSNVAMVSSGGGTWTAYVNASAGGSTASGANAPTHNMFIGSDNGGSNAFVGNLADVAIWTAALTVAELTALSAGARPSTIRSASLIGYWPLDGLQSPEPDLSGQAKNGTLTGTGLATTAPPLMMLTPRWPQVNPAAAVATTVFPSMWSSLGTRTGTRQVRRAA